MSITRSSSSLLQAVTLSMLLGVTPVLFSVEAAPRQPQRPESQQEFWARYDQRDWSAAIEEGRRLVQRAGENAKQKPLELANALTLLGNALLGGGATSYSMDKN